MRRTHHSIKLLIVTMSILCTSCVYANASRQTLAPQADVKELYSTAKRNYEQEDFRKALDAIEEVLKIDSFHTPAMLLKYKALVRLFAAQPSLNPTEVKSHEIVRERKLRGAQLLKDAADNLEKFLQLKPDAPNAEYLRGQLAALRAHAEAVTKPESEWTIFSRDEVTEKAQLLARPEPRYTEEARNAHVRGTVKLLGVFAGDGTVKHLLVLQSPGYGLTETSMEAASKIQFKPATKDGRPVSTVIQVEYGYSLY